MNNFNPMVDQMYLEQSSSVLKSFPSSKPEIEVTILLISWRRYSTMFTGLNVICVNCLDAYTTLHYFLYILQVLLYYHVRLYAQSAVVMLGIEGSASGLVHFGRPLTVV